MKSKIGTLGSALALVVFAWSSPALASAITVDFESLVGYDLFNGAALTTTQSHSPTHSAELTDTVNDSLVRIRPVTDYGLNLKLGTTSGSFWTRLASTNSINTAPYMIFGVDVNGDGLWDGAVTDDALVIAFINGSNPTDTWFQTGLDANTKVHVVGNRAGLTAGTFDAAGTQDTLAALSAMSTGLGGSWGNLGLLRIYAEIGEWGTVTSYDSFVDDININVTPEPGTYALLGIGLAGLGFSARRRKTT